MALRHCDSLLLALRNTTVRNVCSRLHHRTFGVFAALDSGDPKFCHGGGHSTAPARDSEGDSVSRISGSMPNRCESTVVEDHSSKVPHAPHDRHIGSGIPVSSAEPSHACGGRGGSRSNRLPPGPSLSDFIRHGRTPQSLSEPTDIRHGASQIASAEVFEDPIWDRERERERREGSLGASTTGDRGANPPHFARANSSSGRNPTIPTDPAEDSAGRVYFESYGCQMNVADLELVLSILSSAGYTERVDKPDESDVILINTCAIRENAENKIWHRLGYFKHLKQRWYRDKQGQPRSPAYDRLPPKVAVLGCMAERLKEKLLESEKMVDVVCGPDAYRDLPRLLSVVDSGQAAVNTLLSLEETYADVSPIRISRSSVTAFVSIMRGCDNMCSYCIVPFTRGRERSRPLTSILREVREVWEQGVREVVLLGQNVNSYRDLSQSKSYDCTTSDDDSSHATSSRATSSLATSSHATSAFVSDMSEGFRTIYKPRIGGVSFSTLLDTVAALNPEMRFRFTSPHPKDFPPSLLQVMRNRPNVCLAIHLPAQSGSSSVLERMRRGYTREAYLSLVENVRETLPGVAITSDFITGFCGETEEDHLETLSLIEHVGYDMAYMFAYSLREKTHAHRNYEDDVPEETKQRRLAEMIATFRRSTLPRYEAQIGRIQLVLIEGPNKRAPETEFIGRNDTGHRVMCPLVPVRDEREGGMNEMLGGEVLPLPGDFVEVEIVSTTFASLRGIPKRIMRLTQFHDQSDEIPELYEECG